MKFKSDIEVQAGLKDSSGSGGTSGQVLSSTVTGTDWVTPSGGGTIGGSIADNQIAVGSATANEIEGSANLTYAAGLLKNYSNDAGATSVPNIELYRDSASPATNDVLSEILFTGKSSTTAKVTYAGIKASVKSPNAGGAGILSFTTLAAATLYANLELNANKGYLDNNWFVLSTGTLDIEGSLNLDGAAGTAKQSLVSLGSGNTPEWDHRVRSDATEGGTGSVVIGNMVKITQTAYTALGTPDADTLYIIVG